MHIVFFLLAAFYVFTMPVLFVNWHSFFRQDVSNLSSAQKRLSIAVLIIATLAWPLVLPFAYVELLDKFRRTTQAVRLYHTSGETSTHPEGASDPLHFLNN